MSDQNWAQLIAAAAIALIALILWAAGRSVAVVAVDQLTYTPPSGGGQKTLLKGDRVPAADVSAVTAANAAAVTHVRVSALSTILVGKDNRTSTSKTVAFLWTLAIAYGLIALIVAKWLGDPAGWNKLVDNSLQEEYLIFLGGPYAAAILAKVSAVSQSESQGKPPAPVGGASTNQLISDDEGATDLGDFQYVVFNLIALTYFLGALLGHLDDGFPDLPPVLAGLALTSAGGYAAKKFIQQARPTLNSVVPPKAAPGAAGVQVYGINLLVPASVSPTGSALPPMVAIGGKPATVTASDQILGSDRVTVTVAPDAAAGAGTVTVVRADGIAAVGPAGSDGIPFMVG